MTAALRFVLGDQLSRGLSSLADLDPENDVVLMVEVGDETTYVAHHPQKIALILSAMRHFAEELRDRGVTVDYVTLDDPDNTHSFSGELARAVKRHKPGRVVATEPGEWRVWEMMGDWESDLDLPVEILTDDRFYCTRGEFAGYVEDNKTGRMEYFYREMRRRTGLLMEGDDPAGGAWNFDQDNRKSLPKGLEPPHRMRFRPDETTQAVLDLVAGRFSDHFGDLEGFGWAVTREEALRALRHFINDILPNFGDYQDAMKTGEDYLYHALVSPYLNIGLLTPDEVCDKAEQAWKDGAAPLNAVEGFIRQILGWREFVRGIYWTEMPGYVEGNYLNARRDLPAMYWGAETDMRCMAECIGATRRNAYAHHIQRLMVTGNFALLAGVEPRQIEKWYLEVYADAFDWVELPNVHGMVMHADGGRLGSKPYAASGAYINRMSDYCKNCDYSLKQKTGREACPFNYLYWNFLIENEDKLGNNQRMGLIYGSLRKKSGAERDEITRSARAFLDGEAWD
ncbi:MAG: cryptochrome/photolyase family protein [Rhodobacteraceae bacterium]|uniref:Deoxyribodipyrimidine photolyase-related protein n=1 Tax=Salipiger profundus TaxID=1229727 RepID=A0A1U7D2N5_9RHOB|nr:MULTISPECIES: cryptochrome/photolyase family protein [Salipiger]APX22345.1 deoxyribodipyrimidine photolyase-related protein [Salipiger profundus]MAB05631.1 cryptochrome/photolyase family protein [Paracoccaceae bacterium]GGA22569.1 deoxyribodipyrimidine photo-lyase [Salipiger profundus]SFD66367.1 deoxyribodipyrimidine photolyase-related protein [Salipiger profundus]